MIIEITSLLVAIIYVPVALYLKKELNLKNFIVIFISTAYLLKSSYTIYMVLIEESNYEFLVYILLGAVSIIWVSYEKILHVIKNV